MKANKIAAAALASALLGTAASAATVQVGTNFYNEGDSFTILFDGNVESTPIAGLTGKAKITFKETQNDDSTFVFDVELENTTSAPVSSRISAFGFDTNPDPIGGSSTGAFDIFVLDGSFPNGFGDIDFCVKDGGGTSNCQGGGGGGIATGDTGLFTVSLNFGTEAVSALSRGRSTPTFDPLSVDNLVLSNFGVRYQSIEGVREGTSGTGSGTLIPEPSTWAMMISSFGLLGLALRRRRVVA